ncbi:hypothetical protein LUX39_11130 [Actinomadura madurae]|nr:hypothetical protein [Actinomadura madurae]MCQ0010433.1 hypothetical protein [Actinomadura madurae]MCQ0014253.1 hypothetical protein [Actinomadura madurae]
MTGSPSSACTRWSACANSTAVANRCSGVFAIERAMTSATCRGTSGRGIGGGASLRILSISSAMPSPGGPLKAGCPARSWYRVEPSE